jgi:hypothetical protein
VAAIEAEREAIHFEAKAVDTCYQGKLLIAECKWSDADADGGLRYLRARFPSVDAWQICATGRKDYRTPDGIRVAPALELLKSLI